MSDLDLRIAHAASALRDVVKAQPHSRNHNIDRALRLLESVIYGEGCVSGKWLIELLAEESR